MNTVSLGLDRHLRVQSHQQQDIGARSRITQPVRGLQSIGQAKMPEYDP